jgi:hypothetical protein
VYLRICKKEIVKVWNRSDIETYCRLLNLILDGVIDEPAKSCVDRNLPKLRELINSINSVRYKTFVGG